MKEAYIIDGVRSAIGSFGGGLSTVRADDLAASVISQLVARHPALALEGIDEVVLGCANQAGEDNRNVARMALLLAGLPTRVPGITVNRLCASGLSAVVEASRAIRLGDGDLIVAGGVEHMTRAPFVLSKAETPFSRSAELFDTSIGWRFVNQKMKELYGTDSMGETAENVAAQFGISREDQDRFALWSQEKALTAREKGRFESEIVPIAVSQGKKAPPTHFQSDEFIRPGTTLESLSKLRPAFKKEGSVTAGNSSGINDGACALLVAGEESMARFSLKPRGRIVASAAVGLEPRIMGMGPVEAVRSVLQRSQLTLDKIDIIELNEAFAAQSLACLRELGLKDADPRVNPNGGAIALGHPLGMSGARLVLSALHELELQRGKYALCTMCVGVGQGMAAIVERVQ
jgi:3-oxoadipyl-CoA thiolase